MLTSGSAFGQEQRIECPEVDTLYSDWFQKINGNVASWEDCGRICALTTICKFWSWSEEENLEDVNVCYLYETNLGLHFDSRFTSGERGCPEDQACRGEEI